MTSNDAPKTVLMAKNFWWPFGSHLLHMKWAYIYALEQNCDFFYKYNNSLVFPNGSIEYYYENISTIAERELDERVKSDYNPNGIEHNLNVRGHFVPSPYTHALDFHSCILKQLYKPTEHVKKAININPLVCHLREHDIKYIALHIRLGDKVNGPSKETNYIPLEQYFDRCKDAKQKYGLTTIVVCSDTSDGLNEIIRLNNDNGNMFEILSNAENRNQNVWNESIVQKVKDGYDNAIGLEIEYLKCFINFEYLLNSQIIIGNWNSCFCLVPVEMRNNGIDIDVNMGSIGRNMYGIITKT